MIQINLQLNKIGLTKIPDIVDSKISAIPSKLFHKQRNDCELLTSFDPHESIPNLNFPRPEKRSYLRAMRRGNVASANQAPFSYRESSSLSGDMIAWQMPKHPIKCAGTRSNIATFRYFSIKFTETFNKLAKKIRGAWISPFIYHILILREICFKILFTLSWTEAQGQKFLAHSPVYKIEPSSNISTRWIDW